ncbi:MAG: efflux RND transporter permease subunit [Planctomycetaceae bacterium]|jgi:hydrophobic/amphiphilic exporter-1 (mainly G- bacteria), HAE1 family|nr:efflux RND transporter permease subunit [Planctomycetaceae bacterium]MBT6153757.1 efflux RND transporter permease subunit [Planctomycetaceae bacterium]MBT6495307.1 efflux RND transporter permease subunit [Planctomycetaceae bacterium]
MSIPSFSVRNTVLVNMVMLLVLLAGGIFAFTLVREMFPESRPNKIAVIAVYPGVQPPEIEKAITIKVEEAVRDIEGVEKVNSTVNEGFSTTIISLLNEVDDVDAVMQLIKNDVDALQDLPDDLEKITVTKLEPKLPVIMVAVYGDDDEADLKRAARDLRDDLLLLPGVSDVQISGMRDDEISVEIIPDRLLKYDITFDEVATAIRLSNLNISGGNLKGDRTTVAVRTVGEEDRGVDLEDIVVGGRREGHNIYLRDVAEVHDGFVDTDLESYFNGKPALNLVVYKTASQDAIQISSLVKAYVLGKQGKTFDAYGFEAADAEPWYVQPFSYGVSGISWAVIKAGGRPDPSKYNEASQGDPFDHKFEIALHTDLARFVEGRLDLMMRNGLSGLLLVVISLNLFLNWRVAFWSAVGLPVSFLGTFIVMWMVGASLNLLSLFGLIIVLGIIVDDAIVIGENIFRHVEEGMSPFKAAVKGAEEVMWPVTIAVATTIAAFAPMFFIRGQIGDFMSQLPLVVLAALSVSLVEALLILPAHLAHLPPHKDPAAPTIKRAWWLRRWYEAFGRLRAKYLHGMFPDLYERFLRVTLRWRYVTVAAAVASLFIAAGMMAGGIVEWVFIQKMDSETLICALEMPVGTPAENAKTRLLEISNYLTGEDENGKRNFPEVTNVQMHVARQYDVAGAGSTGTTDQSNLGQLVIELMPADQREQVGEQSTDHRGSRSSEELLALFREKTANMPGVNSVGWDGLNGGPGGRDIHIVVSGKDFEKNVAVAERLKTELSSFKGVFDLDDDFDEGKREIQLRLRESARPTGITVSQLGSHVRSATYGREARRITRNREDVRIMVRYPEEFRRSVYNIESMRIPTAQTVQGRGWIPLGEVAELGEGASYQTLHRSQQERAVTVYGAIDQEQGVATSEVLGKIRKTFDSEISQEFPGVQIEFLGSFEEMSKAFSGLRTAMPVALVLIFVMLAGLFRSYIQPLVVMAAIPFGFMGAVMGHWLTDTPFTILSAIGMVALTGILVNDSLVLVDFINKRVADGLSHFEATVQGARLRLRAILLTTLTTVAGLTPLMFEKSFQAVFLIPMAVTLTFGLLFATILTLIIVPSLNMIFFDVKSRFVRSTHVVEETPKEVERVTASV